jgi:hypothetical protein
MIFSAVMNYLQMSPGSSSYFFPHIGEVKQIHTHKGPSDKSLFLHTAPSVKSTPPSPLLFHQDNATEKYQFSNYSSNIYLHLCVPHFQCSVSWSSEMLFGVIYLETWGSAQPYVVFLTLKFRSFFFFYSGTHTTSNYLTLHKPVSRLPERDTGVCTARPVACYCWDREWTEPWVEDTHKYEPKIKKKLWRNPYSRMKDICLWSHIALTSAMNACMHSFLLPLIGYELIHLSTHISQHYHETKTSL